MLTWKPGNIGLTIFNNLPSVFVSRLPFSLKDWLPHTTYSECNWYRKCVKYEEVSRCDRWRCTFFFPGFFYSGWSQYEIRVIMEVNSRLNYYNFSRINLTSSLDWHQSLSIYFSIVSIFPTLSLSSSSNVPYVLVYIKKYEVLSRDPESNEWWLDVHII